MKNFTTLLVARETKAALKLGGEFN